MVSFFKKLKKDVMLIEGKENLKQVIVVRTDLGMSPGKLAAQVAHGAVGALIMAENSNPELARIWLRQGQKKVVVGVKSEAELDRVAQQAGQMGIVFEKISDAGRTELAPGTATCVGIGPDVEREIDKITGSLSLLK